MEPTESNGAYRSHLRSRKSLSHILRHLGESFVESFVKVQILFLLHSELLRPLVYPVAQFSCFVKPSPLFFSLVHACILLQIPLISQELFQILHLLRSFVFSAYLFLKYDINDWITYLLSMVKYYPLVSNSTR